MLADNRTEQSTQQPIHHQSEQEAQGFTQHVVQKHRAQRHSQLSHQEKLQSVQLEGLDLAEQDVQQNLEQVVQPQAEHGQEMKSEHHEQRAHTESGEEENEAERDIVSDDVEESMENEEKESKHTEVAQQLIQDMKAKDEQLCDEDEQQVEDINEKNVHEVQEVQDKESEQEIRHREIAERSNEKTEQQIEDEVEERKFEKRETQNGEATEKTDEQAEMEMQKGEATEKTDEQAEMEMQHEEATEKKDEQAEMEMQHGEATEKKDEQAEMEMQNGEATEKKDEQAEMEMHNGEATEKKDKEAGRDIQERKGNGEETMKEKLEPKLQKEEAAQQEWKNQEEPNQRTPDQGDQQMQDKDADSELEWQDESDIEDQAEQSMMQNQDAEPLPHFKWTRGSQLSVRVGPGTILAIARSNIAAVQSNQQPSATSSRCPILSLPYPVEQCGAELQRAFPGQIGRFYVTNTISYAYMCNKMSIEMAAESMGFDKRSYLGAVRPVVGQVLRCKSYEKRIDELASDLAGDPRLTLMFLKPKEMHWNKLGNCLIFERWHPHRRFISDKWQMFLVLRRSATLKQLQLTTASGAKFDFNSFILYTANPGSYQRQLITYLDENPGAYILKRTNYSQGIGIRIYNAERPNTVEKLRRCVAVASRTSASAHLRQFIMQKYIERPLLIDKRKFDLRVYLMLLSCKRPVAGGTGGFEHSYFAFCYPGYVKLSCYPYSQLSSDLHVHLTNQFVQKQRASIYTTVKEATTWFPDELNAYLNRRGRTEADWCQKRLYGRIRAITGYVAAAFRPHLDSSASPASVFRIYGPDFIIDEDLNVWLLEVNAFPSYAKNTAALSGSIRNMWREAVTLATEATLRYRNRQPVEGLATMRNFRMAYSSEDPRLLADLVRQNFA